MRGLLVMLLAAPAAHAAPVTVAALGLQGVGIPAERASFYSEVTAQALASSVVRVVSSQDLGAVLGLERQKQLLGCSDANGSCAAELGAALGAEVLLRGEVAQVGTELHATLKLVSATDGRTLASRDVTGADEPAFTAALKTAAREMSLELLGALGRTEEQAVLAATGRRSTLRSAAWVPVAVGAAAVLTGAILFGFNETRYARLSTAPRLDDEEAVSLAASGPALQLAGAVCLAAGATFIVVGVVMRVLGREPTLTASLLPTPGGAAFTLGGAWP